MVKDIKLTDEQIGFLKEINDRAQEGNKDTREIILGKLADYAYNDDKLYQLTRFTAERAEGILKNHIVNEFFQKYYAKCRINFHFSTMEIKSPCVCRQIGKENCDFCNNTGIITDKQYKITPSKAAFTKDDIKELLDMSPNLLNTCMKMYIGDNGLGRKEMFEFLKALDNQVKNAGFGFGNMLGLGGNRIG